MIKKNELMKEIISLLAIFLFNLPCYGQDYWRGEKFRLGTGTTQAVLALTRIIDKHPNLDSAYYFRGAEKADLGDVRGAIVDLDKAIELNPKFCEAYYYRGRYKIGLKNYQDAIADLDRAIELHPNDFPKAYYYRGLAKISLSETKNWLSKLITDEKTSGCEDLSKAGQLGYDYAYKVIKERCN